MSKATFHAKCNRLISGLAASMRDAPFDGSNYYHVVNAARSAAVAAYKRWAQAYETPVVPDDTLKVDVPKSVLPPTYPTDMPLTGKSLAFDAVSSRPPFGFEKVGNKFVPSPTEFPSLVRIISDYCDVGLTFAVEMANRDGLLSPMYKGKRHGWTKDALKIVLRRHGYNKKLSTES